MRFINGIFDRIFAVLGALLFAQAPLFMQDYQQQLLGRTAELQLQIDAIRKVAGNRGLDWYITKFINSSDPDFSAQGHLMQAMVERQADLQHTYQTLSEAPIWVKPIVFLQTIQTDVAVSAVKHFDLGLPLTLEGAMYALFGLLFGMALYRAVVGLLCSKVRTAR